MRGLLVLIVACVALGAQSLPPALTELFNKGVQAEKAGQLDAAEKAFLAVLEQGGKQAFVYNNLGIVYRERGDNERALVPFREAIRLNARYAAPRVLMGSSLLALGRVKEAAAELEAAMAVLNHTEKRQLYGLLKKLGLFAAQRGTENDTSSQE